MTRSVPLAAYDTLGVSPTDDFATIRAAWLRQVRENHPDRAEDPEAATRTLAALNDAYDALCWHRRMDEAEAAAWRRTEARRKAAAQAEAARRARPTPSAKPDQPSEPCAPRPSAPRPAPAEARAFRDALGLLNAQASQRTLRYA